MPNYLNIREAAEYMGISPHTLYKLVERNEVPAAKIGGSWRLSPDALDELVSGQQRSDTHSPQLLVVTPDAALRREIAEIAISRGATPQLAGDPADALIMLSATWVPGLVLYEVPDELSEALEFMKKVRSLCSGCRLVAIVSPERAVDLKKLMSHGWFILLPKPVERPEVVNLIATL